MDSPTWLIFPPLLEVLDASQGNCVTYSGMMHFSPASVDPIKKIPPLACPETLLPDGSRFCQVGN